MGFVSAHLHVEGVEEFLMTINFFIDLQLKQGPKQSCSLHRNFYNDMWHATYTQVNQGDFLLLVVGSQIDNLTLALLLTIIYVLSTQMGHPSPF